jgi:hypothetical protein
MGKKPRSRPKKMQADLKRNKSLTFWVMESEYHLLEKNALDAGRRLSTYLREMTLKGTVMARMTEEEKELFRAAVAMSNDLHQLLELAREQGMEHALISLEAGRNAIDNLLNKIKL